MLSSLQHQLLRIYAFEIVPHSWLLDLLSLLAVYELEVDAAYIALCNCACSRLQISSFSSRRMLLKVALAMIIKALAESYAGLLQNGVLKLLSWSFQHRWHSCPPFGSDQERIWKAKVTWPSCAQHQKAMSLSTIMKNYTLSSSPLCGSARNGGPFQSPLQSILFT